MPRRFRKEEEERIRAALIDGGSRIMGIQGVRKTSIDELVREAGISKGSFYRFFPGKEALALEVIARWERGFHEEIAKRFRRSRPRGPGETAEVLRVIYMEDFPRRVAASGFQGLLRPDEIAYLVRSADADHLRVMDEQDLRFFSVLRPLLHEAGLPVVAADKVVMAGLRILFDAALGVLSALEGTDNETRRSDPAVPSAPEQRRPVLGPGDFESALTLLIRGFLVETCGPADRSIPASRTPVGTVGEARDE